jgi:hypothetical protein
VFAAVGRLCYTVFMSTTQDQLCCGCKKVTIVNYSFDMGMPLCTTCEENHNSQYKLTRMQKVLVYLFKSHSYHKTIKTGGFDPYSGDRWTIKFGKLEIETNTTICYNFEIRYNRKRIMWHIDSEWKGIKTNPLARVAFTITDALEDARNFTEMSEPHGLDYWE